MLTFFVMRGSLVYTDDAGRPVGCADVFTRIENARAHFASAGLDPGLIDGLIR